ncbi:MAG: V-type ATP synthase subunit E family protein [Thaumarchaeota archaeon]|nr:V-type ATP synthase subunit E family protein [Nitrososphaerota archaeon]
MSKAASDTLEKVSQEFETEVLADLQEGKVQAQAAVESARKEAAAAVEKILETSVKHAESLKRQIIGAAELESRDAQLRSLEKTVNEAFGLAVDELKAGSGPAYEKSLAQLVKEGLDVIGPRANVSCSPRDRKAVSAAVRKLNGGQVKLAVEDKSIETIGGVVLVTPDGSVRFDNTFEARLERTRSILRKEVAGILTGS